MGECGLRDEIAQFLAELIVSAEQDTKQSLHETIDEARIGTTLSKPKRGETGRQLVVAASNAIGILSRIDASLKGMDFKGINLDGARLVDRAIMTNTSLSESFLNAVQFRGTNLSGCDIQNAKWESVDCTNMTGKNMTFVNTTIFHQILLFNNLLHCQPSKKRQTVMSLKVQPPGHLREYRYIDCHLSSSKREAWPENQLGNYWKRLQDSTYSSL